jgi:Domain of unknown function (DUF303).
LKHPKKQKLVINDILIGQVWLCSGQSNMNYSAANGITDMKEELKTEMSSQIRLFTVTKNSSKYPQEDCEGKWVICDKNSAYYFSAVGYFFGKKISLELNQPVGLVNSSWGGTPIEVWIPENIMRKNPTMVESWNNHSKRSRWNIGTIYNAMIYPILRNTFAGAIWYQGESNKENALLYGEEFKMMIESWRKDFKQMLPFYFVQIAPHDRGEGGVNNALVREQQTIVSHLVPKTGMVVINDLVDDITNIHPQNKKDVGERLAAWALSKDYKKLSIDCKSPEYKSIIFKHNKAIVSFDTDKPLICKGASIEGLEICDESMKFIPATGMLDQSGKLIVWNKAIRKPVAVRYCFSDGGIGNIFGDNGLPLAPFRTDSDNSAKSAVFPDELVSVIQVVAEGKGFEKKTLAKGAVFFMNRKYKLIEVPTRFSGFDFLSHAATISDVQKCKVTASQDGKIYIVVRINSKTSKVLNGWKLEKILQ